MRISARSVQEERKGLTSVPVLPHPVHILLRVLCQLKIEDDGEDRQTKARHHYVPYHDGQFECSGGGHA
jgi:hypothetical protein